MKVPISDNELGLIKHSCIKNYALFYRNGDFFYERAVKSGNGEIITYAEFKKRYPKCDYHLFYRYK